MLLHSHAEHEANSVKHHFNLALNKIIHQDLLISQLQTTVESQRENTRLMLRTQNQLAERLERVKTDSNTFLQDQHIWKIPQFSQEVKKAKESKMSYYLTKQIYTSEG